MDFLKPDAFFDMASFVHRDVFAGCKYVWDALGKISGYLEQHLEPNVGRPEVFQAPAAEDGRNVAGRDRWTAVSRLLAEMSPKANSA